LAFGKTPGAVLCPLIFPVMYVQDLKIQNLRVFAQANAAFQYPDRVRAAGARELEYPNVNLILGNNGAGKSTLLKAIALACLGPLAEKFAPYMLVRRSRTPRPRRKGASTADVFPDDRAVVRASLQCTWQDLGQDKPSAVSEALLWSVNINRTEDEESIELLYYPKGDVPEESRALWAPINRGSSPAYLTVGYGATRRVDTDPNAFTPAQRLQSLPLRHQRIQSLFFEGYTLVPLGHWLPQLKAGNPGRCKQVFNRINEVLPAGIEFTERTDSTGEYLFCQGGALVPFAALSDGCRAFIGWVADLLYHICFGCPPGVKLVDNCGIVLVDEIDLHLHPEWQRTVLPRLAKTFPRLQFIVTTHSPIVVGTLQRENLWVCEPAPDGNGSVLSQKPAGVQGLNSDQILLTEYFGLRSSRAPKKEKQLDKIAAAAERKVPGEAGAFLRSLVTPLEDEHNHD
jgi:energy-coupling factor transporter ATP-binding protein EcfA2